MGAFSRLDNTNMSRSLRWPTEVERKVIPSNGEGKRKLPPLSLVDYLIGAAVHEKLEREIELGR